MSRREEDAFRSLLGLPLLAQSRWLRSLLWFDWSQSCTPTHPSLALPSQPDACPVEIRPHVRARQPNLT